MLSPASDDALVLRGVVRRFGSVVAVDAVDLDVAAGEILAVLGPSGCGKSTLLRVIAGLEPTDGGHVSWQGRRLDRLATHERGVGLMFQDHALFPHRDVRANVAFGLRMARIPRGRRAERVAEVLELVGLSGYDDRRVETLSGGEAQRVALARALAPEPAVLLLDEPLGSLDRDLRERLAVDLRSVLREAGITAIHVTHDHDEAFTVADRLALMRSGRIVQVGTPESIRSHPADPAVARFLGLDAIIDVAPAPGRVTTPWGALELPEWPADAMRAVVLPEGLRVLAAGSSAHPAERPAQGPVAGELLLSAVVRRASYRGDRYLVTATTEECPAELTVSLAARPEPGDHLVIVLSSDSLAPIG
ncbi:MAG: ABC transporter ATP-binding protein [Acidimicrobiales bacterium]|nr:ABC transporter ATP-binding protein [Acidimicrobiales bacterium]